jgi:hypothetical protein
LTICRKKGCGWDIASDSEVTAKVWRTRHEHEQVGHQVTVVALEEYLFIPPEQSKNAA